MAIRRVFQALKTAKLVFGRGSATDRTGGAYDAPPDPLVGWGAGHPLPIPYPRRLRRRDLSASVVRPPYAYVPHPDSYTYAGTSSRCSLMFTGNNEVSEVFTVLL